MCEHRNALFPHCALGLILLQLLVSLLQFLLLQYLPVHTNIVTSAVRSRPCVLLQTEHEQKQLGVCSLPNSELNI